MDKFNTIEEAIEDFREGKLIVVIDDPDRENEGDLIMSAQKATPEKVNFMIHHAGGLICVPTTKEHLQELQLEMMVKENTDARRTAFTISVDAKECKTGISAFERSSTILKLADGKAKPEDFTRPGHIFPLMAREFGVLRRAGHTEAAVDLCKLAGLYPAGVLCEIINEDGTMKRTPQLLEYAQQYGLKIITVEDLIEYRRKTESFIERIVETTFPTKYGAFQLYGFLDKATGQEHVALVKGDISGEEPILCRVHSECLTGDVFGSLRCDCGEQLSSAMQKIEEKGRGIIIYLRQEGRGIGLINKLKAYKLQDDGMDTVEANIALGFKPDLREYGIGAEILANLGAKKIIVMTNNPQKLSGLRGFGIEIVDREPLIMPLRKENERYMKTKCSKMGHLL